MKDRTRDFLVGATALIGLIGLALTLFLFGEFKTKKTYPLHFRLDSASGLYKASPVTLNGVRIGEVKAIAPAQNPLEGVDMTLEIANSVRVPKDLDVSINQTFVGDASLALKPRPPASGGPTEVVFLKPGETLTAIAAGGMLDEVTAMLDERLGDLKQAAADFRTLAATWTRVGQSAEALLAPRTPEQVDTAKAAGSADTGANLASAIARADAFLADIRGLTGDESFKGDTKRMVSRAADVFDQASEAVDAWTTTAKTIETRANQMGDNIDAATRDFASLSKSMGETLDEARLALGKINSGEGTIGQLVNNPDLYKSLTDAAKRLEKALLEAQLLVEKYRKEGVPIRF